MDGQNQTGISEFVLRTFPSFPEHHTLLFAVFLIVYVISLVENVALATIILVDSRLHTPMYLFLWVLSILETCYTLAIIPLMLVNLMVKKTTISHVGCITQMFAFIALGTTEIFTITAMAYDRYVAVCNPLRYHAVMSSIVCIKLLLASFAIGSLSSVFQVYLVFQLHYCGPMEINHFFCDVEQVMLLASTCDALYNIHWLILMCCAFLTFTIPFVLVCSSYTFIILSILRISTALERRKSFSSCSSHLILVIVQYNCLSFIYLRPKSSSPFDKDKFFAVIYALGTPIMIPLIYSLRNKVVKSAFRNLIGKTCFQSSDSSTNRISVTSAVGGVNSQRHFSERRLELRTSTED